MVLQQLAVWSSAAAAELTTQSAAPGTTGTAAACRALAADRSNCRRPLPRRAAPPTCAQWTSWSKTSRPLTTATARCAAALSWAGASRLPAGDHGARPPAIQQLARTHGRRRCCRARTGRRARACPALLLVLPCSRCRSTSTRPGCARASASPACSSLRVRGGRGSRLLDCGRSVRRLARADGCAGWPAWCPLPSPSATCLPQPCLPIPDPAAEYVLAKPGVYFVTMRQLIEYMQNPVPADQITPQTLGSGNAGGAGPVGARLSAAALKPPPPAERAGVQPALAGPQPVLPRPSPSPSPALALAPPPSSSPALGSSSSAANTTELLKWAISVANAKVRGSGLLLPGCGCSAVPSCCCSAGYWLMPGGCHPPLLSRRLSCRPSHPSRHRPPLHLSHHCRPHLRPPPRHHRLLHLPRRPRRNRQSLSLGRW